MNAPTTSKPANEQHLKTSTVTHFEIYGDQPTALADFYREALGWEVEQMPGIHYWRIQTGAAEGPALHGGLTQRAIPDLNGWMLFVQVASLDDTVARIQNLGGSIIRPKTAVPRTAWVTIVADPAKNIFGIWQADPTAFPMPEPD
jgi:predicted enzyme related to lactoylglutathione lyase